MNTEASSTAEPRTAEEREIVELKALFEPHASDVANVQTYSQQMAVLDSVAISPTRLIELVLSYGITHGTRLAFAEYLALLANSGLFEGNRAAQPTASQAHAAFMLAIGSSSRLHPAYTISSEQLLTALRHCGLEIVQQERSCSILPGNLIDLVLAYALKQPPRLFLGEYLQLVADSRLYTTEQRPTDVQARSAFTLAVGSGSRLHPSYSMSFGQLLVALEYCGL
jgi:hypothetical protein